MTKKSTKEKDVIDQILDRLDLHGMTQEELFGADGLAKKLTSRLLSKALEAEMHTHITYGYPVPRHHGCDVRREVREALACEAERQVAYERLALQNPTELHINMLFC